MFMGRETIISGKQLAHNLTISEGVIPSKTQDHLFDCFLEQSPTLSAFYFHKLQYFLVTLYDRQWLNMKTICEIILISEL